MVRPLDVRDRDAAAYGSSVDAVTIVPQAVDTPIFEHAANCTGVARIAPGDGAAEVRGRGGASKGRPRSPSGRLLISGGRHDATMPISVSELAALIREIPDFPAPGVLFRDMTPLLADPTALWSSVELLAAEVERDAPVDFVVGAEARGFLLGPALAMRLGDGQEAFFGFYEREILPRFG
ncbi:MAG: hypothetical protein JST53_04110 [Actinobacteria bacterium]|nr:hypothetical protein [Actinomycetota bacterium]